MLVARKQAYALGSHADNLGRTDLCTMALVAHVHSHPLGVARCFSRCDKGVEAGRRTAARQQSASALWVAEPTPQPVDDYQFQLARAAGDQPSAGVGVVSGGHEVGEYSGPSGRCRDEPKATRVVQPRRNGENISCGLLNDFRCWTARLGRLLYQPILEFAAEFSFPSIFAGQAVDPLHHKLCGLARQIKHLLGCHLEAVAVFIGFSFSL